MNTWSERMDTWSERMGHIKSRGSFFGDDPLLHPEQLPDLREGTEHRQDSALSIYRAARTAGTLDKLRIVSYRCAKGCLLLDIFNTPVGPASFKPMVKFSPEQNADTDAVARDTRTVDGKRRWVENADLLLPPECEYWVSCDHVLKQVVTPAQIEEDAATRRKNVTLPRS